jgi:ABC-2 type transport system ATP-binding protein
MAAPNNGLALRCEGIVKRFGAVLAVDGLDLEVRRGECFGLLGPNGAGKTTTVEILEGLLRPDAGTVEVLGQVWSRQPRELRSRIGVQLQEAQLIEKLTVLETLTIFRSFYGNGLDPEDVLGQVGLVEKRRAWVRNLSGGQLQRLSLASALISDPELLFLDEPTTGLDPQSRRKTWGIIDNFRRRGGTALLTTHYMEEAEHLCDRVAIVDRGRVIAQGTPAELISSLGAEHVVEFETEDVFELQSLERLQGIREVGQDDGITRLTVDRPHEAIPTLMRELERQQVNLTRLVTHHATLEDVFVSLTGRHLRDE